MYSCLTAFFQIRELSPPQPMDFRELVEIETDEL